jgi:hypothetical protein
MSNKICTKSYVNNDYPVDIQSNVAPNLRASDAHTSVPEPQINGGLYCGPQNNAPWMPINVAPTTTNFMQTLLKTCNPPPPPGATEQYPGDNRLGNNYTPMPGINWYKSSYNNSGPYHIKVIDPNHNKKQ